MEGTSPKNRKRFQVHREFECSRIEQALLAEAYRRILPDDLLKFVERDLVGHGQDSSSARCDVPKDMNSVTDCVLAMGGH